MAFQTHVVTQLPELFNGLPLGTNQRAKNTEGDFFRLRFVSYRVYLPEKSAGRAEWKKLTTSARAQRKEEGRCASSRSP